MNNLKLKLMIYLLKKHLVSIKIASDKIDIGSVMKTAYKHYIKSVESTIMLLEADLESGRAKKCQEKN